LDRKSKVAIAAKVIFSAALIYFSLVFVVPRWQSLQLTRLFWTLSPWWLLAAAVVLLADYCYLFGLWVRFLRFLGSRPALSPIVRAYVLSLLPKYLPGKVISQGVRARLALQAGVSGPAISSSLIWEVILVLGSAAVIAFVGLLDPASASLHEAASWLVRVFALGTLVLVVLGWVGLRSSRWGHWAGLQRVRERPLTVAVFLGAYALNWPIFAVSHWFLANAITDVSISLLMPLMVALAVSWAAGFISVIAPAGLGIREGVLYLFVLGWMSEGQALLFVTLSRLLGFAAEVLLTGLWGLYSVVAARTRARAP
jgi:hypothetical protein